MDLLLDTQVIVWLGPDHAKLSPAFRAKLLDPVDRMLIAHAIHADLTLVSADETMRRYPVRSLW